MSNEKLGSEGFTLIELVITAALLVIVVLALFTLYENYAKVYNSQQATGRAAGSASAAANELQNLVLQADQIEPSRAFSGTTYTTGPGTLVLRIPSIDSSGSVVSNKYDYAAFYTTGSKLYRILQVDASSVRRSGLKQLSDSVSTITFGYNNANVTQATKIDTDIQTRVTTGHQSVPYHLYLTLYLRN